MKKGAGNPPSSPARTYVALLHAPVYNRGGEVVASAVTNLDIHDIARAARTYGLAGYFIVTPDPEQRAIADRICRHWLEGYGAGYNYERGSALSLVETAETLDHVLAGIERREGAPAKVIATTAAVGEGLAERVIPFGALRESLARAERPHLLLLGTGWGLAAEVMAQSDGILSPIEGTGGYNHLSVRGAAAIIMDRLFGQFE